MYDPLDFENRPVFEKLDRLRRTAFAYLWFEELSECFWPLATWVIFFLGLWLLNTPVTFGIYGHEIFWAFFLTGTAFLLVRGFHSFSPPNLQEANRRLENDNTFKHRPLDLLDDTLSNPEKAETRRLWFAGKQQLLDIIRIMRGPRVKNVIPQSDIFALRMAAASLFITGLVMAGGSWQERLQQGLFPFSLGIPGYSIDQASITITPPEYTGFPVTIIKGREKEKAVEIPVGSILKAQVNGGLGTPVLMMGEVKIPLKKIDKKSYVLETPIGSGERIALRQSLISRLSWPYTLLPDTPPIINKKEESTITDKNAIKIPLTLFDDYGVRDLTLSMDLDPMVQEKPLGNPYEETRAVMTPAGEPAELSPVYDLSFHTWAGLPVILTLTAKDAAEQTAELQMNMTLPERSFKHPIAIKLIEMRKTLAWDFNTPHDEMIRILLDMMAKPDSYDHELSVMLALRTAASRLAYSKPSKDTAWGLIDLFWQVAVHLEDGDVNLALRQLQQAQRELEQSLSDPNSSKEEIARNIEKLREAMANYFRELGREMQKRMAEGQSTQMIPPEMLSQMLSPEDLQNFFDQLQGEALNGDPEKARELLSQLNKLMDMLDPSFNSQMPPDMQMMSEGINELQELIRRQEALLDQTRAQSDKTDIPYDYGTPLPLSPDSLMQEFDVPPAPQGEVSPKENTIDTSGNKTEQEALRFILGKLMTDADSMLGEIPENMGLAEQEMRGSSENLGLNNPHGAIPHQEKSLEYLRQAMNDMAQQMMARMKEMTGFSFGQSMVDPLGRPMQQGGNRWFDGSEVQIPDEAERKRVEEILKILRDRSGEFDRPQEELEYYRRLLKQF